MTQQSKRFISRSWSLIKNTFDKFSRDEALRMSAALAYYTVFSLSPMLILALGIAGMVYGPEAVRGEFSYQLQNLLGSQPAQAIEGILADVSKNSSTASIVGIVVLCFGATGVFVELRSALNQIFGTTAQEVQGFWNIVKARLLSMAAVLSLGFILVVSLIVSAVISTMGKYMIGKLPASETLLQVIVFGVSFITVTGIFGMIFRLLPQSSVRWNDVWPGAILTAFLFNLGKFALGFYLGKTGVTSAFGAAGSIALILVWTYYSSAILFFGAEFTSVLCLNQGRCGNAALSDKPVIRPAANSINAGSMKLS